MSNRDNEYQIDQTIRGVSQAIIVLKGTEQQLVQRELVKGTMILMGQYDTKNSGYVGNYEHGKFKFLVKAWVEQGMPTKQFEVDEWSQLDEIAMLAELESVPMNFIDEESTVLLLGPFDEKRIKFFTQNCVAQ